MTCLPVTHLLRLTHSQAFCVILVPALRGFVAPLRQGIRSLVLGLRILEGDTYSVNEANDLHLETNTKVLKKTDIARAKTLILEGLGCND